MANTGGMVRPPVTFGDVNTALGTSHTDLEALVKDANINKWAWYKPIRHAAIGVLTEAQRSSAKYGLVPTRNTAAENLFKGSVAVTEANFNLAVASTYDWTYNKPIGGSTSPYRLTDFVDGDVTYNRGYKHNTDAPFDIMGNWTFDRSTLATLANSYYVNNSVPTDRYNWTLSIYTTKGGQSLPVGNIFTGYKARFGIQTWENINGSDSLTIPITYLLDNINTSQNWRIGVMVYVPAYGNLSAYCGLFVSRATLRQMSSTSNTVQQVSPEICTNQWLAKCMYNYMVARGKTTYEFRALPVIVKDADLTFVSSDNAGQDHRISTINAYDTSVIQIYSLPSGSMEIKLNIGTSGGGSDTPSQTSGGMTLGSLYQTTINTGNGESWNNHNLNQISVYSTTQPSSSKSIRVDLDYSYFGGRSGTINGTYNINNTQQFMANGKSYYGIVLLANVELQITTVRTFQVSSI